MADPHCWHRCPHRIPGFRCKATSGRQTPRQWFRLCRLPGQVRRQIRPPGKSCVFPVGTIMEANHKLLPRKNLLKRKIPGESDIFFQLFIIYINRFCFKTALYMPDEQFLFLANSKHMILYNIYPFLDVRIYFYNSSSSPSGIISPVVKPSLSKIRSICFPTATKSFTD